MQSPSGPNAFEDLAALIDSSVSQERKVSGSLSFRISFFCLSLLFVRCMGSEFRVLGVKSACCLFSFFLPLKEVECDPAMDLVSFKERTAFQNLLDDVW